METEALKKVSRGAVAFFSGTFISRFSGLGRDLAMAFCFGSHPAIAAFMVAYRCSNLFRRLIGEGTLSAGFIPSFERVRRASGREGAQLFRDVFFSLLFFVAAFIAVASAALWICLEWGGLSSDSASIVSLVLWMLPGLLFICLYAVSSALLQCERKFFLSSFAPVLFNLIWIGAVLMFQKQPPSVAVVSLSCGVVLGFFMQWAMLFPALKNYMKTFLSWREIFQFRLFSDNVKALIKPLTLSLIGVSATQVNSFLDASFARYTSLEGPAYLWYAIRIQQLPLALFGVALSAALLPALSQAASQEDETQFQGLVKFSLRKSFHFMFPCLIALFVLAVSGVNLLYGRGSFGMETTQQTIYCLWGYGVGLLPHVFVLLLAPAFYAKKNYRTPVRGVLFSVALHIALNVAFVFFFDLGAMSIAISTSISSWFNFFFLYRALGAQKIFDREVVKSAFCALLAGGMTFALGAHLLQDPTLELLKGSVGVSFSRNFLQQLVHFFAMGGFFALTFIAYAWLLDIKDVLLILRIPQRKRVSD